MSITYYYAPMSTAVRTTWALEELGVRCERIRVDIPKKETKTAEFLKLNPNGVVPVLVVDGTPLYESTAILLHLGETYGVDKGMYPAPGLQRAVAQRWMVWANVGFYEPIREWARQHNTPADKRDPKAHEAAKNGLDGVMRILDDGLAGKSYLVGDAFSLADLAVASYLGWLKFMAYDTSGFKNVSAWSERCLSRPAAIKTNSPE